MIVGASGNVGTSLLPLLLGDRRITSLTGLARRVEEPMPFPGVTWVPGDVARARLEQVFEGADVVVHLGWAIQPSHDETRLWMTNVLGSRRVFDATAAAGVPALVYASSIGAYSRGRSRQPVDESWPVEGTPSSFYARHKATVEWILDRFEEAHPEIRVTRARPALIFKREAASGVRRLFLGPLVPSAMFRHDATPALPLPARLSFQAVHSADVARAIHTMSTEPAARGAYNLAADPLLSTRDVTGIMGSRHVDIPLGAFRVTVAAAWRLRAQPTPPGWLDMAAQVPEMDSTRAREDLSWAPLHTARQALEELIEGLAKREEFPTPPLRAGLTARTA